MQFEIVQDCAGPDKKPLVNSTAVNYILQFPFIKKLPAMQIALQLGI